MGQQQLLLIVLGVIIVGIAVVVGINVFTASASSSNRDAVVSDLTNLASIAQTFYRKPTALGGGNNSFTPTGLPAWSVPAALDTTGNGTYSATVADQQVTLVGIGTQIGNDNSAKVKVTMVVGPNKIISTTPNN